MIWHAVCHDRGVREEIRLLRTVLGIVAVAFVAIAGAGVWQELRYLHARRGVVQDRQPLFHSGDAFHTVTFLDAAPDADLFAALRELRAAVEAGGGARMVYAGKVALDALSSAQLVDRFGETVAWDAVVLVQFGSRADYERIEASEPYRAALAAFRRHYAQGMERPAALNLALPLVLLGRRVEQVVTRAPSHYPFEPAERASMAETVQIERLAGERELGRRAVVVVNLVREGSADQQAADRAYTRRMFGLMAEGVHGPMHVGNAVRLESSADFDRIAIVYYPGVDYFMDMVRSRFYQGIVGGKQLGDTQASITVPILDRL